MGRVVGAEKEESVRVKTEEGEVAKKESYGVENEGVNMKSTDVTLTLPSTVTNEETLSCGAVMTSLSVTRAEEEEEEGAMEREESVVSAPKDTPSDEGTRRSVCEGEE